MAAADRVPALSPDAEAYGPAAAAVLVVDGGVGCGALQRGGGGPL